MVHGVLKIVWCSPGVFRDTPHESVRKTNQALPPHCRHPSTTRILHSCCFLCGLSETGFRNDVVRTNVCMIPRTSFSSPLFWRGVSGLPFPVTMPQQKSTTFPPSRPPLRMTLRNAGPLTQHIVARLEQNQRWPHTRSCGRRPAVPTRSSARTLFGTRNCDQALSWTRAQLADCTSHALTEPSAQERESCH